MEQLWVRAIWHNEIVLKHQVYDPPKPGLSTEERIPEGTFFGRGSDVNVFDREKYSNELGTSDYNIVYALSTNDKKD